MRNPVQSSNPRSLIVCSSCMPVQVTLRFKGPPQKSSFLNVQDSKVTVNIPRKTSRIYECGHVLGPDVDQKTAMQVFSGSVEHFKKGNDVTVLAFGQSGSGKSYTLGLGSKPGLVQLLSGMEMTVSIYEIYNNKPFDLLGEDAYFAPQQKGLQVKGLKTVAVGNDLKQLVAQAKSNRRARKTKLNPDSSRSHAFLVFETKQSKLTIVDLAGSEKVDASFAETRHINQGLTSLRIVLRQLIAGEHVSYRDNVLTRLLEPLLKGHVHFLACARWDDASLNETVSTLGYATSVLGFKPKQTTEKETETKEAQRETETKEAQRETEIKEAQREPPPQTRPIAIEYLNQTYENLLSEKSFIDSQINSPPLENTGDLLTRVLQLQRFNRQQSLALFWSRRV